MSDSEALVPVDDEDGLIISELPAGRVLCGRYTIKRKLADGAAASVYLANDEQLHLDVALKILDPLRGADPVGHARFEREFEILSRLDHPSIARCFRMERHQDLDFLVLEYVEGPTLEERLAEGRFKVSEAVNIAAALSEALEQCHRQGILHRDLKPSNIVLHAQRGPVVLDFGVAWFSSAANLTRTGAVIGSPQYLAPEAFASPLTDARADIYAVGAMLFEMLTGRPVHLVDNVAELAVRHVTDDPPLISSIRTGTPAGLDAVVARAIAARPEERFATAQELARALRAGQVAMGARLHSTLPCRKCRTSLIIDLPFCPGCGEGVAWKLERGPYAVQLTEIRDLKKCMTWLLRRHGASLRGNAALVARRLPHTPVPLVVGASLQTAEQLAAEAREVGCTAEIVRARAIVGATLKPSAATTTEVLGAAGVHFTSVMGLGSIMLLLGKGVAAASALPALLGMGGIGVAWWYVRRPVLRCEAEEDQARAGAAERKLRETLGKLDTDRARRLAAGAVARAAPRLLEQGANRGHVMEALSRALDVVTELDAHARYLGKRSRSRLAAELVEARSRAEKNDPDAVRRVVELEQERVEMTEVSVAHDLAARRVLEATLEVSDVALARR